MAAAPTPHVPDDESRGRSFSTDPRNRAALTEARLRDLRRLEAVMTRRLHAALDQEARSAAFLARTGSDLSSLRFETESPRFTHMAVAIREGGDWWVHQLLNTHEGHEGHLYRQPLIDFFRDDPIEYASSLLVPSLELQQRIARIIQSPLRRVLYTPRYSRIAYPFSTRYINSNQWLIEILASAQGGGETRSSVQGFLAERGFRPTALSGIGPARQLIGRLQTRNTRFDDHPTQARLRGRFHFVMEPSLRAWLVASDDVRCCRVIELEDPRTRAPARRGPPQDSSRAPTA